MSHESYTSAVASRTVLSIATRSVGAILLAALDPAIGLLATDLKTDVAPSFGSGRAAVRA